MSTTIRVSETTRRRVADIAAATGRQMQAVVDDAVAAYERLVFWDAFEAGYEVLSDDPEQWASVGAERAAEEQALGDASR
jgi:predicted transcriptional regulator